MGRLKKRKKKRENLFGTTVTSPKRPPNPGKI